MQKSDTSILRHTLRTFLAASLILCLSGAAAGAAGLTPPGKNAANAMWQIEANQLRYVQDAEEYHAEGKVLIKRHGTTLTADSVKVNRTTMEAVAEGNVTLKTRENVLTGSKMTLDLNARTGTVFDGMLFIEKKNFYIRGDKIEKTGEASYAIRRGSFTTCDGQSPDWKVTGEDLSLDVGGYGSVKQAALWVKKMPVAYLPFFIFPVKRDRQSGLLAPEVGYSDRNGAQWVQPFFWAIHPSCDTTLYYHHIQNRGEKAGTEFRYALGPASKGTLMADTMEDRQVDDGTPSNSQWGYTDDAYLRSNSDRYWFRMKADQQLPYDMTAQLDLDVVSDQDYLREFDGGITGYNDSNAYFASEFGRDLDDEDDPIRENRLNIKKLWTRYSINTDIRWYDNVLKRRWEDTDDTLQQLPTMRLDTLKQPVARSPLYLQSASEYSYFYRKDGLTGHRLDIHPRLSLPLQLGPFFSFEPAAGLRQTSWLVDPSNAGGNSEPADDQHRQFYELSAVLSTDLYRVYKQESPAANPIKHTLIPELRYEYIPDHDQTDYPDFDGIDRIGDANRLSFALTHLLTEKYFRTRPGAFSEPSPETSETRYKRFFRFLIEQSYDFNHWKKPEGDPLEPLYAELDLTPVNLLSVHAEAQWSHEDNTLLTHLLSGRLRNKQGDWLRLEYRYFKDLRQSIDLGVSLAVTNQIRLSGEYERNLDDGTDIDKQLECLYQSQCWSVALTYTDDETDQRVSGMIRLHGLGEIGDRI